MTDKIPANRLTPQSGARHHASVQRYTHPDDLPPQVRAALSSSRQQQWLEAFNATETDDAYTHAWKVVLGDVFSGEIDGTETDLETITFPSKLGSGDPLSFLADISGLGLDESDGKARSWVQMLRVGKFQHPIYGELDITPERVKHFADNANANVRGQMLDVDYDHKERDGKAAGWIVEAQARADGLWGLVDWTPQGAGSIRNGEYRYFSPEFKFEWESPTGVKHDDVLFGGALTNRPFLKDMLPVNLSEVIRRRDSKARKTEEVNGVKELLKELSELLGLKLSDDAKADSAAIIAGVKKLSETESETLVECAKALDVKLADGKVDGKAVISAVKNLIETAGSNGREVAKARKFAEDYPEEAKLLSEQAAKLRESEAASKLSEWKDNPKTHKGLPAKLHDPVKAFRMKLDGEIAADFDKLMDDLTETGTVDLSEHGRTSRDDGESTADAFDKEVTKYLSENKEASYSDAVKATASAHPDLARGWQKDRPKAARGGEQ